MDPQIPKHIKDKLVPARPEAYYAPGDPILYNYVNKYPRPCPRCGISIDEDRITKRLSVIPRQHWRTRCESCLHYQNKQTGEFTVKYNEISLHTKNYYKDK